MVEKNTAIEDSLVMDASNNDKSMGEHVFATTQARAGAIAVPTMVPDQRGNGAFGRHGLPTPAASPGAHVFEAGTGIVQAYLEMHDYAIDATFRGFIVEKDDARAMFVFFDQDVVGQDLKSG